VLWNVTVASLASCFVMCKFFFLNSAPAVWPSLF